MRAFAILLSILLVVLIATNPGPERFERFVEQRVAEAVAAEVPEAGPLGRLGGQLAGRLVRQNVERDNYVLFSVYTLRLPAAGIEQDWRFLGVGGFFVETQRPEALR